MKEFSQRLLEGLGVSKQEGESDGDVRVESKRDGSLREKSLFETQHHKITSCAEALNKEGEQQQTP